MANITSSQAPDSAFDQSLSLYSSVLSKLFDSFGGVVAGLGFWILLGLVLALCCLVIALGVGCVIGPFMLCYHGCGNDTGKQGQAEGKGSARDVDLEAHGHNPPMHPDDMTIDMAPTTVDNASIPATYSVEPGSASEEKVLHPYDQPSTDDKIVTPKSSDGTDNECSDAHEQDPLCGRPVRL